MAAVAAGETPYLRLAVAVLGIDKRLFLEAFSSIETKNNHLTKKSQC